MFSFVDKKIAHGEKRKALILHVDALKCEVYVSLREELLKQRPKRVSMRSVFAFLCFCLSGKLQVMNKFQGGLFPLLDLWEVEWRESKSQQEKSLLSVRFCVAAPRELAALCGGAAHHRALCHHVSAGNSPAGCCAHRLPLQRHLPLRLRKAQGGTDTLCDLKSSEGEPPWSPVSSTRPSQEECFCKSAERVRDSTRGDASCCETLTLPRGPCYWYC